jgi:hypothetical protein
MSMSLYSDLKGAGIPLDHHESDLYVKATPKAREILSRHIREGLWGNYVSTFISPIDNTLWYDVPFAYEPFWIARRR